MTNPNQLPNENRPPGDALLKLKLKLNEIFFSIQGESTYAGMPTVFVRTSGCHLRCHYCDTTYAYSEGFWYSIESILDAVHAYSTTFVCVTGGEPLLQKPVFVLIRKLCDLGKKVSVETSGSIDCQPVDLRAKLIIDIKTPDSGASNSFLMTNILTERIDSEFKFVICSERDFNWAEAFCREHELHKFGNILYSPSFDKFSEKRLAQRILAQKSLARMQLQLHKYIWSPNQRGV